MTCLCRGEGLYFDEASGLMKVCDCPAGYRRREYLEMTEEEKKKARAADKRKSRRKKEREPEPLPF